MKNCIRKVYKWAGEHILEIAIVITILGILAAIVIPEFTR